MQWFMLFMSLLGKMCVAVWNCFVNIWNYFAKQAYIKSIENENKANRGLIEQKNVPVSDVLDYSSSGNMVITGGEKTKRDQIMHELTEDVRRRRRPVVILHEGNTELEDIIRRNIPDAVICNENNKVFDPFYYRTENEIVSMVRKVAAAAGNSLNNEADDAVIGMLRYIESGNKPKLLSFIRTCPFSKLIQLVRSKVAQGDLTQDQGNEIEGYLFRGQNSYTLLARVFETFCKVCENILFVKGNEVWDIVKAVSDNRIIMIDVSSGNNKVMMSMIAHQLQTALNMGLAYTLVSDEVGGAYDTELMPLIEKRNGMCRLIISTQDICSMLYQDEKKVGTVLANSAQTVYMKHSTAGSADKLSEIIGKYDKKEITYDMSNGKAAGGFSVFPTYNTGEGMHIAEKPEYIVKSSEIQKMQDNEMYISDNSSGIRHVFFTI